MKQTLHIFSKDIRRLWMEIAVVMLAIAYFALLDIGYTVLGPTGSGTMIIEFIVGAAVWFLIARAVHEESLTGENEFWLTRPYERSSLLGAKIMMAILAVAAPLFVADCMILSAQSLSVTGNFGGLVLRQLMTATWLILPPFAIASITRSITEDVMVWLVALAIAGVTYFPGTRDFRASNEKYALVVAIALIVIAASRQYWRRGTIVSRALIAVAVLLPAFPIPESTALAIESSRAPEMSGITVTPKLESTEVSPTTGLYTVYNGQCKTVAFTIGGVRAGWRLAALSQNGTFESDGGAAAGGKTWSTGWLPGDREPAVLSGLAQWQNFAACISPDGLNALGVGKPLTLHVSVAFEVIAENAPVSVKATLAPFDVPGVGMCQFATGPRGRDYMLACKAPVWLPPDGTVAISTSSGLYTPLSRFRYAWTPMNLLPGLSPVYKWITMTMDSQIREAIEQSGQIEFRTETGIAVIRRDLTVRDVRFSASE